MTISPIKPHLLSIAIISAGLLLPPQPTYATVANGVYAYEKGNYQQARAEWLPYAALGNPNALYNLGQLSRMGRGTEQDFVKAEAYYLRAAEKGHVGAQRNLGTLYYFGRINAVDHAKAFNWLTKAATSGDIKSQLMTGTMYFNGEATEKDNIRAYAWIFLSSQSGLTRAINALDKLTAIMTPKEIMQAKDLAPSLISNQLSPDDVGLMVQQQEADKPASSSPKNIIAETMAPPISETPPVGHSAADNYRVQIASFSTETTAQKALKILQDKFPKLWDGRQGNIEYVDLGKKGVFYRLQLSPFNRKSDAQEYCRKLQENNQDCYVIKSP